MDEISATPADLLPAADRLRTELLSFLRRTREIAESDPSDSGLIRLELEIGARLERGEASLNDLGELVQLMTAEFFLFRARRLASYLGETDPAANEEGLEDMVHTLADDGAGGRISFEAFRARIEREVVGIVITGHPTFGISAELTEILASLAVGRDADGTPLDERRRAVLVRRVCEARHGTDERIALGDEQAFALAVIDNVHAPLQRAYGAIVRKAAELYPADWRSLRPRLLTLASWVAYDIDGRLDILWTDSLGARITVAQRQLRIYRAYVRNISAPADSPLGRELQALDARLGEAIECHEQDLTLLPRSLENDQAIAAFSRFLAGDGAERLRETSVLLAHLDAALAAAPDDDTAVALVALRAEAANFGLGVAHTHFRLNATNLANALRAELGEDAGLADFGHRRRYLQSLDRMIETVRPVTINFGSLLAEQTSAKRLFMLVAQILKHVDSDTPIRFLVAETEEAATLLTALYFAKLFGVEERVDLSPLFETPAALRHGHEIIAELLANRHYRRYIEGRGRLCIETGFSDSGRYIGAVASSLAIERLRMKTAQALSDAGLEGIEFVIFDTHGESMGRGAHPGSFSDRLDYLNTPESRRLFERLNIPVKEETSFQGADGYVYFATPDAAFATVCRLLEHGLRRPDRDVEDVFYRDTDYSLEFFLTLQEFNDRLFHDPDYATLLTAFEDSLLYPTGSRPSRRQLAAYRTSESPSPSQIRAIPHNAILQQWGFLANSLAGLGRAIAIDPEHFVEVYARSDRCQRFMALVGRAAALSDFEVVSGYAELFDPAAWLRRAYGEGETRRRARMRRVASRLHEHGRFARLNHLLCNLMNDAIDLRDGFLAIGIDPARHEEDEEILAGLRLLHAVRLALIRELFLMAAGIPRFSPQADITIDQVLDALLRLDVEPAISTLQDAFPAVGRTIDEALYGGPATYRSDAERGYLREHRELFDPILAHYDLVRRISSAVSHVMGGVG